MPLMCVYDQAFFALVTRTIRAKHVFMGTGAHPKSGTEMSQRRNIIAKPKATAATTRLQGIVATEEGVGETAKRRTDQG